VFNCLLFPHSDEVMFNVTWEHLIGYISVFSQLDAQNLFHNNFYFMPLHVSSTCDHHQEVKIALHSLWHHHTCRWPPRVRDGHLYTDIYWDALSAKRQNLTGCCSSTPTYFIILLYFFLLSFSFVCSVCTLPIFFGFIIGPALVSLHVNTLKYA